VPKFSARVKSAYAVGSLEPIVRFLEFFPIFPVEYPLHPFLQMNEGVEARAGVQEEKKNEVTVRQFATNSNRSRGSP
jgi:hypothetical protein